MSQPARERVVVITGGSDGIEAEPHVADFANLDDVRALAATLRERYPRIDVLVNNAGLIAGDYRIETADGHELTFQVNHLAPFLLTVLLRDPLSAGRATVITTSSQAGATRRARLDLDDLDLARGYSGPAAVRMVVGSPARLFMRSPDRGADTIVWLATTTPGTDWPNGGYFSHRRPARPHPLAADEQLARGLWDRSASLGGL